MKRVEVPTYTATIFIANRLGVRVADAICQAFCDELGECVTVDPTNYIYTGDHAPGVRIGFINYGRFPREPAEILARAEALALRLIEGLRQDGASIVATDRTFWLSKRAEDAIPLTPLQET
jgi:hypothetical protein